MNAPAGIRVTTPLAYFDSVVGRALRRSIPITVAATGVVLGLAYSFLWAPVVRHTSVWITPSDFWATYRAAHYVGWGDLGGVYAAHAGVVTFPGILVLLAPVAMLTGALGLTESYPLVLSHPTAWVVCGPIEMIIGCIALFGVDALAARLGLASHKRLFVSLFVAVGLWNTVVLWGHPEDAIAVGLTCYALVAVIDRRPTSAGWFFGAAIVMQPLVLLVVPLAVAYLGWRSSWSMIWRCIPISAALVIAPLTAAFSATERALVEQPNFPNLDHRTPWTRFAPTLGGTGRYLLVAAGPIRLLSVAAACLIAVFLRRRLADPQILLWACGAVLLLRCATESVMVAYYLWPATVFVALLVAKRGFPFLLLAFSTDAFLVAFSDLRLGEWPWWLGTVGSSLVLVAVAFPRLKSAPLHDDQMEVVHRGAPRNAESALLQQRRAPALTVH
jgi:hypothetical protein